MSTMSELDLIARETGREDALLGVEPILPDSLIMRFVMKRAGLPFRWDADLFDQVVDAYCEAYHEGKAEK